LYLKIQRPSSRSLAATYSWPSCSKTCTPEVVAVAVDVVADLDDLVIDDLGHTEAGGVVREVQEGLAVVRVLDSMRR
jgi:hypothetical protein